MASANPGQKYDVAIVGAGPAGAACAARLASGGATVALLDPSHPREKPCGGGVTARALRLIDGAGAADGVVIESASFRFGPRDATVSMAATDERLRVFSRQQFDGRLVRRAVDAGASLLPHRVRDVAREANGWRVTTSAGDVRADWVVGADGANSLVRKRVSHPFSRADLSIACGYFLPGPTATRIDIGFEARPAGYFWSFPRHDHVAVGVCAQADESSVRQLMPIVDRWLAEFRLPPAASEVSPGTARLCLDGARRPYSWPIPSLRAETLTREKPAGRNWLLLGDAAGLVDPITREGIFFALQSGHVAAASILRDRDPSSAYAAHLHDAIYPELILAARIRARFYRASFMSLLVYALQRSSRIQRVMTDLVAGEQPYHSLRSRLLKTLELRLMLQLVYRT